MKFFVLILGILGSCTFAMDEKFEVDELDELSIQFHHRKERKHRVSKQLKNGYKSLCNACATVFDWQQWIIAKLMRYLYPRTTSRTLFIAASRQQLPEDQWEMVNHED